MKSRIPQISQVQPAPGVRAALLWALLLGGCSHDTEVAPDKIEIASGNDQMGDPLELLPEPLTVRVMGPRTVDFLGRRGYRRPVPGAVVTFQVEASPGRIAGEKTADGAPSRPGGDLPEDYSAEDKGGLPAWPSLREQGEPGGEATPGAFLRKTVFTNADGIARVWVQLGARNGDYRIEASLVKRGEKVRFRAVAGVKREVPETESVVGAKVSVGLKLSRLPADNPQETSKPVRDRRVYYQIAGGPPGGLETAELKEKDKQSRTDEEGQSRIEVTLGDAPGVYFVLAEIEPRPDEEPVRGIFLTVVAMDWVLVGLKLAAGVMIFVVGVRLLGNGFLLATSRFLHLPTESWAHNRFRGYLGGLAAGAVFESSSLVISHVTNLANGGLLTAAGGLSLVLGASAGGTMLPQILSFEIGALAAPFLAAGMILLLLPRRSDFAPWGWILLGAGLTLTGWSLLQDSTELAGYSRRVKSEFFFGDVDYALPFTHYTARFLAYFAIGSLAAFVLRTSNLIVVLAILLASSAILRPASAVPLIIGANLGSAAMVFLLSLRKRREAKRLGLANLVVHVLGSSAVVALSLIPCERTSVFIWLVERILPGRLLTTASGDAVGYLATAHTAYNFLAGIGFLFLPRALLSIVDRLLSPIPATQDVKPFSLDRNLVAVPTLALRQVSEEVIYLTEVCRKSVAEGFDSFRYNDLDLSDQVARRGEVIDEMHREVSQYLVEVAENQLSRPDSSRLEILQTATSSLVRIGELGERLRDLTARKLEEHIPPEPEVDRDLNEVYDLVMAQFTNILTLLRQPDMKTEESAVKMVERLAKFSSRIESQTRQRLGAMEAPSKPLELCLQSLLYHETFNILFQVAGHLAHIAQCMRILSPDRI